MRIPQALRPPCYLSLNYADTEKLTSQKLELLRTPAREGTSDVAALASRVIVRFIVEKVSSCTEVLWTVTIMLGERNTIAVSSDTLSDQLLSLIHI